MCLLFAVSGEKPVEINIPLSDYFRNSFIHKHGWGYVDLSTGRPTVKRESQPAYESEWLKTKLASPFTVKNAMFHLRYATVGEIEDNNTHPLQATDLTGRTWWIIHNGTIFDGEKLDKYFYEQQGSTDTERLLLYLVNRIGKLSLEEKRPLSDKERFKVVDRTIKAVAKGNKLNIIISDGEIFYIHANSRSGSRLLGEAGKNDFLYELHEEGTAYFSTTVLDPRPWTPVKLNTVFAYRDGKLLYEGKPHEYEYIETDEDIKNLYWNSSRL